MFILRAHIMVYYILNTLKFDAICKIHFFDFLSNNTDSKLLFAVKYKQNVRR